MENTGVICPVCWMSVFEKSKDYVICHFCGWENDDDFLGGGSNDLPLDAYQKRYMKYVSENPQYIWLRDQFPGEQ